MVTEVNQLQHPRLSGIGAVTVDIHPFGPQRKRGSLADAAAIHGQSLHLEATVYIN